MSVNCARPGCWHPRDAVQGDYPHYFGHKLDGCHDCDGFNDDDVPSARPCPGYRTQAQQEAWEALAKVNQQHHFPPWTVIERLLELYP